MYLITEYNKEKRETKTRTDNPVRYVSVMSSKRRKKKEERERFGEEK